MIEGSDNYPDTGGLPQELLKSYLRQRVTLVTLSVVPRDVPRLSGFIVNKSSSGSHRPVTTNRDCGRRSRDFWRCDMVERNPPAPLRLRTVFISDIHLG